MRVVRVFSACVVCVSVSWSGASRANGLSVDGGGISVPILLRHNDYTYALFISALHAQADKAGALRDVEYSRTVNRFGHATNEVCQKDKKQNYPKYELILLLYFFLIIRKFHWHSN